MITNEVPQPPDGLRDGGRRIWISTMSAYELAAHEAVLLREACRTIDLLDELQPLIDAEGAVLPWGDGVRAHPAAVEARQHRIALARLFASLGIPADDAGEPRQSDRSELGERFRVQRGGARGVYSMRPRGPM